jgi:hypothetical protein
MSKDTYFDMCEQLGQEPVESEIPVDLEDFPLIIQQCFKIYWVLKDCWDPMGGSYLGKEYSIVFELFKVYEVEQEEEKLLMLDTLQYIDKVRSDIIRSKKPK